MKRIACIITLMALSGMPAAVSAVQEGGEAAAVPRELQQTRERFHSLLDEFLREAGKNRQQMRDVTREIVQGIRQNREAVRELVREMARDKEMLGSIVREVVEDPELRADLKEAQRTIEETMAEILKEAQRPAQPKGQ